MACLWSLSLFLVFLCWNPCLFFAHLAHLNKKPPNNPVSRALNRAQSASDRALNHFIKHRYQPSLRWVLDNRYLTLSAGLAIALLTVAWLASGRMGFYMAPKMNANSVIVSATLPVGSPQQSVEAVASLLEQGVVQVVAENGGEQLSKGYETTIKQNSVSVGLYLTDASTRPVSTPEVADAWRAINGEIPGLTSINYNTSGGHDTGSDSSLNIRLSYDDTALLQQASDYLVGQLSFFEGISEISGSHDNGIPQRDVMITPEGRAMGLTAEDISRQLRSALFGSTALKQQQGRNEVSVVVKLLEEQRNSEAKLLDLKIRTPDGAFVPLSQVATLEYSLAPSTVNRVDGRRTVRVKASMTPRSATPKVQVELQRSVFPRMLADFPGLTFHEGGDQKATTQNEMLYIADRGIEPGAQPESCKTS